MVVTTIDSQKFYYEVHQQIYKTIVNLYYKGNTIDLISVKEELEKKEEFYKFDILDYLVKLMEVAENNRNVNEYLKEMQKRSLK